jgi:small subunit ribosomal protein S17
MSDDIQTMEGGGEGIPTPLQPPTGSENETSGDGHAGRHRRTMTGTVVSTKMDKTAVVSVTRVFLHPKYRKYVRRKKKYMAHDEHGACKMGDFVMIEECRPMSRHKHWRFLKTVRKGAD